MNNGSSASTQHGSHLSLAFDISSCHQQSTASLKFTCWKKKGKGQSLLLRLMAHISSHLLLVSVAWNIKENLKEWNKTNTTPPRWDAGMFSISLQLNTVMFFSEESNCETHVPCQRTQYNMHFFAVQEN